MRLIYKYIPAAASLLISLALPTVFAAEPTLAFRNIKLGDDFAPAQIAIAQEFGHFRDTSMSDDTISIVSGDSEGVKRDGCPVSASRALAANCLNVRFVFWPGPGGKRLSVISVAQSFAPPIPFESVLEKMQEAYGAPRQKYEKATLAPDLSSDSREDAGLIWGGHKIPQPPFRPTMFMFAEDFRLIGGKYITAVVYRKAGLVSGYEMRIVDSDRIVAATEKWKAGQRKAAAAQQKANIDSVKF